MSLRIAVFVILAALAVGPAQAQRRSRQLSPAATIERATPEVHAETPKAKAETPEEVYAAYSKSLREGDYTGFITRATPAKSACITFELGFAVAMRQENTSERYIDNDFCLEATRKAGGRLSVDQTHAVIQASIKDKRAFFRYVTTELATHIKEETTEPLRKVTIKGDRARGVVTRYTSKFRKEKGEEPVETRTAYDSPVHFARSGHTWLVDFPNREEMEQDNREAIPIPPAVEDDGSGR